MNIIRLFPAFVSERTVRRRTLGASAPHVDVSRTRRICNQFFECELKRLSLAPTRVFGRSCPECSELNEELGDAVAAGRISAAIEALAQADNADLRRGAAAVIEDVLPASVAAIAPARPATASHTGAAVTITLVRWPFT